MRPFIAGIALDTGRHPFLTFSANAGTTYQLRAVGTNHGDLTLKITATNRPIIVVQPFSRTVATGGSVFFGIVAAGNPPFSAPFSYQWRSNGVDLRGETRPVLSMDNLTTNHSGGYSIMVSNAVGGSISVTAFLKVTETTATPQLKANGGSNGPFDFSILGEPGRLYRIQSSTHLVDWSEERSFPKEFVYHDTSLVRQRNGLVYNNQNVYSVPEASRQNSYRTTDYVPPLAACINNLAVIRFAKEIWALEIKANGNSVPTPGELAPYMDMKNGGPACPLSGSNGNFQVSYTINLLHMNPSCKISLAHLLEEPEF